MQTLIFFFFLQDFDHFGDGLLDFVIFNINVIMTPRKSKGMQ